MQRIADFLGIAISEEAVEAILPALNLDAMRQNAEQTLPAPAQVWKDGAQTFFFKGTNGRWKEVLTAKELGLYEDTASKVLTPDCKAWLERNH